MAAIHIPRLDLTDFTGGDSTNRQRFVADLDRAFSETRFVPVANHGLSSALISALYQTVQDFFDLPEDVKRRYEVPELAGQPGYSSKGKETAKDAKTPDLKEFWQRGQTIVGEDSSKVDFPDNPKVTQLPSFDNITGEIYKKLVFVCCLLLLAIRIY